MNILGGLWRRRVFRDALSALPILIAVSLATFLLLFVAGDPAAVIAGEQATDDRIAEVRSEFGLDRPALVQYFDWLGDAVRGDLGQSLRSDRSVLELVFQRVPATASIATLAIVIATAFAAAAGLTAGLHPGSKLDRFLNGFALVGIAVPNFVAGIFLLLVASRLFPWLPAGGYRSIEEGIGTWLSYIILPAIALAFGLLAQQTRTTRASVANEMASDYIRTARAKGLPSTRIVVHHMARNAALPVVTVIGLQIGRAFTGAILVEAVFAVPGVGRLMVDAVTSQDFPVVQGLVVLAGGIVLVANLVVDFSYAELSPSTRIEA